jgi:hypothetical protein
MWVIIGEVDFIKDRLKVEDLSSLSAWQMASAAQPLPPAAVYLDLSGCFARYRPSNTPADAWWVVHAPAHTLAELPPRTIRINSWPGFAQGPDWEMAWEGDEAGNIAEQVCASLHKKSIAVPDRIGFIGARVLISILNEAFLLLGEGSASQTDIDQAMRLGTNYPYGPFEWAAKIGHEEACFLLTRLAEEDPRYRPALTWNLKK